MPLSRCRRMLTVNANNVDVENESSKYPRRTGTAMALDRKFPNLLRNIPSSWSVPLPAPFFHVHSSA